MKRCEPFLSNEHLHPSVTLSAKLKLCRVTLAWLEEEKGKKRDLLEISFKGHIFLLSIFVTCKTVGVSKKCSFGSA